MIYTKHKICFALFIFSLDSANGVWAQSSSLVDESNQPNPPITETVETPAETNPPAEPVASPQLSGESSVEENAEPSTQAMEEASGVEPKVDAENELVPLRFSPGAIGAKLEKPTVVFERTDRSLRFGGREFLFERFAGQFAEEAGRFHLTVKWDPEQISPQRLALINAAGALVEERELTAFSFNMEDRGGFRLEPVASATSEKGVLQIFMAGIPKENLAAHQVCLWDELKLKKGKDIQTLCAPLDASSSLGGARFAMDGEPQPAKGSYAPQKGRFELSAVSGSGMTFKWASRIESARIYEVFLREDKNIQMTVYGAEPVGQVESLTQERSEIFEATIGDLRKFSRVILSAQIPYLSLKGPRESVVHQSLKLKAMPVERDRIFIYGPAPKSTYRATIDLWGPHGPARELQSKQKSVSIEGEEFKWTFAAPKKYQYNRSRLRLMNSNISGSENTRTVFDYEIYRGYSTYLSARMGLSINSQLAAAVAPDFNFIHWFEDLGSSASWSRQRWGLSFGYTRTAVSSKPEEKYETGYFDLYYRFSQGVEGWDETYGLQASALQVQYREARSANLAGLGVFWNRSLPPWFNYFVGFLDFFKKPKWANFSAVYYPVSMTSGVKASGLQVKAVARIDLIPSTYFEGGWALFATTYSYPRTRVNMGAGRAYLGYGYRW